MENVKIEICRKEEEVDLGAFQGVFCQHGCFEATSVRDLSQNNTLFFLLFITLLYISKDYVCETICMYLLMRSKKKKMNAKR